LEAPFFLSQSLDRNRLKGVMRLGQTGLKLKIKLRRMKTDEELMKEYRDGSEEAFEVLYEKYHTMVYAFIRKRIRASEVEDVYQKIWRKLHEGRRHFLDQRFLPWFFVMMRNLIIDEYRSHGFKVNSLNNHKILENFVYEDSLTSEKIEDLLQRLPQETQIMVRKYYLEGASYEELAKSSGLSQTNIRQRLSRALRSLRGHA
jgi:RNA polymerase sigma-70 factor (ECF subfamily)